MKNVNFTIYQTFYLILEFTDKKFENVHQRRKDNYRFYKVLYDFGFGLTSNQSEQV